MYERVGGGMGWSEIERWIIGGPSRCDQVPSGRKVCFMTDSAVDQACARESRCIRAPENCQTADGNPGGVWCCPEGHPQHGVQCGQPPAGTTAGAPVIPTAGPSTTKPGVTFGMSPVGPAGAGPTAPGAQGLTENPLFWMTALVGVALVGAAGYLLLSKPKAPAAPRYLPSSAIVESVRALPAHGG